MADYKGVIADLKSKRSTLQREIERLDGVIGALEQHAGNGNIQVKTDKPYAKLTLIDAAQKALARTGEPVTTTQLVDELERGGYVGKAKKLYPSVYSTLFRLVENNGPAVKMQDGRWTLRKPNVSQKPSEAAP